MICCLCGEQIEFGDFFNRITLNRLLQNQLTGQVLAAPELMEDGSIEKYAHQLCMVERGYPIEVIGAGRLPDV